MNQYHGPQGVNHYQGPPPGQYSGNSQNVSYQGNPTNYHYSGNQYQGNSATASPGYQYQSPSGNYNAANNQGDNERFYQNLSVYRNQDGFNKSKGTPEDR